MSLSTVGLTLIILFTVLDNEALVTSESVRTSGAVDIQESAGVAVLNSAPLQLVLSDGSATWISGGEAGYSAGESASDATEVFVEVTESGFYPSAAGTGEVISVSVHNQKASTSGGNHPSFGTLIAQFN